MTIQAVWGFGRGGIVQCFIPIPIPTGTGHFSQVLAKPTRSALVFLWYEEMSWTHKRKYLIGVCLWCERYSDHHNEHYNWQLQRSLRLNIMVDTKTDQQSHDHSDHYNYHHSWHSNWLPQWPPWLPVTETTTISHPSDLINDDHGWPPQ